MTLRATVHTGTNKLKIACIASRRQYLAQQGSFVVARGKNMSVVLRRLAAAPPSAG
jgi:hypothetical protein